MTQDRPRGELREGVTGRGSCMCGCRNWTEGGKALKGEGPEIQKFMQLLKGEVQTACSFQCHMEQMN